MSDLTGKWINHFNQNSGRNIFARNSHNALGIIVLILSFASGGAIPSIGEEIVFTVYTGRLIYI
jgi:hypothetical protein